jgi:hypothetical protein
MKSPSRSWLLLVLLTGLGSVACTEGTSTPPPAAVSATCHLRIEGAGIQYNGRTLPLPGALKTWEAVLGPPSRRVEVADEVYVWDELGIHAFAREPGTPLRGVFVLLKPRTNPDRLPPSYWPRNPFKSRLCVDGSEVTPTTQVAEVNRNKRGQKFSKGYLDTIYSYDLPPPVALYVRLDLAEDRKPESFSMSLTDETNPQDGQR